MQALLIRRLLCLACAVAGLGANSGALAEAGTASSGLHSAPQLKHPEKAAIMAAGHAGKRIVAVGDYGVVLLSDDGQHFRQAAQVPTRATLTSVYFLDAKQGWAAGHDGTVLASDDGGEHWRLLRQEPGKDRALMSLWFENSEHGLAVGQFGLALETRDGGQHWQEIRLSDDKNNPEAGEKHLLQIVPAGDGLLLVAAEAGAIFRSEDHGQHWQLVQTDNKGSFWTGLALRNGGLLMAGMRGHIYRSDDRGRHWQEVATPGQQQSLTAAIEHADGSIRLAGAAGVLLDSQDGGHSFKSSLQADHIGLSALAAGPAGDLLFSLQGVVAGK